MADPLDAAIGALGAINPWFAIAGLVAKIGVDAVRHANENAKNKVDPTPEEIDKFLDKCEERGEDIVPKRA